MVIAYHVVLGMHGFWLPNDPRGSYSDFVWATELQKHGPATKLDTRRSVASQSHDVAQRLAAKRDLKYPAVQLTGIQARSIGTGIATATQAKAFPVWACSVLPEHTHLIVGRSTNTIESVVAAIKQRCSFQLVQEGHHPLEDHLEPSGRRHSPWARGFWKVFINDSEHLERAMQYVRENPLKDNKPIQNWKFVTRPGPDDVG